MSAKTVFLTMAGLIACLGMTGHADEPQEPLVVTAVVLTEPLYNYEDAPATPDADDPAIWINRQDRVARSSSVRPRTPGFSCITSRAN
jgi:myo-inositol-hexaphosphate 3-phosphohydrolase